MAFFKCKMCGGVLDITENQSVCECEYCGSRQTLPKLADDKKANMYDRANHFRRNNEFDKAMGIYEQILNEDSTDAETYWSLVLCRYGIEYVEDPTSHRRIATINRAQYTSIFDDSNYKSALLYADAFQRAIYEEEARTINDIQKGILEISQKEDPFDIFICYKETDNNGRRTPDSVLANDLYHQLAQEGFKVFFSRITLEDKLGTAYEPYIFAALNSAKIMVVLGTRQEYFNAVWVKNEWSRFLALVKQSEGNKMLIPAYRDMDPYDLPEEFSHLQAQDMSKLGFMQDLIRGIKKILRADINSALVTEKEKEIIIQSSNGNVAPLLKRVFMFLEDKEWDNADEYCEKVLDLDPENAEAYLGKLMAEKRFSRKECLQNSDMPFDDSNHYQKVMRFGSDELKIFLESSNAVIVERNEINRKKGIYSKAVSLMEMATTESAFMEAAVEFEQIEGFLDANEKIEKCYEEAEIKRKDAIFDEGIEYKNQNTVDSLEKAITFFEVISDWKNAQTLILECKDNIDKLKDATLTRGISLQKGDTIISLEKALKEYNSIPGWKNADDLAKESKNRIDEIKREAKIAEENAKKEQELILLMEKKMAAEKRRKKNTRRCAAFIVLIILILVTKYFIIPHNKYKTAIAMRDRGAYEAAIEIFQSLEDYKDSIKQVYICKEGIQDAKYGGQYNKAIELAGSGNYEDAIDILSTLDNYRDSAEQIILCEEGLRNSKYEKAVAHIENNEYADAGKLLEELIDYKDSKDIWRKISYQIAEQGFVGDKLLFGAYEWQILAKEDDEVLLITTNIVCNKPYNITNTSITWENSSLRTWLNDEFYNEFSDEEKALIATSVLYNMAENRHEISGGNDTEDNVFVLSAQEARNYFSEDNSRKAESWWWLRSPGYCANYAARVYAEGSISENGCLVNIDLGVRPALRIILPQHEEN